MHRDKELVLRVMQKARDQGEIDFGTGLRDRDKSHGARTRFKAQVLQVMVDEVAKVNPRAQEIKPQDLVDRRYLTEMENSGFFTQVWAEKR